MKFSAIQRNFNEFLDNRYQYLSCIHQTSNSPLPSDMDECNITKQLPADNALPLYPLETHVFSVLVGFITVLCTLLNALGKSYWRMEVQLYFYCSIINNLQTIFLEQNNFMF